MLGKEIRKQRTVDVLASHLDGYADPNFHLLTLLETGK
jgi:hypothetical protein